MKRPRAEQEMEAERVNLANFLVLLSRGPGGAVVEQNRVFECITCNRRFPSFQALGGHRASHKKPRPDDEWSRHLLAAAAPKPRVHECSVCGVEFPVGQALGGHMRRHRVGEKKAPPPLELDLNLPPSSAQVDFLSMGLRLGFPLVDCFR